ncbi:MULTISPECIES: hypothetical protein [unclassified Tamlana]|uniref:hypothetical protein n=1 Tax=unclassified Tamlana TaxID=2614803 RepID=UPI0026E25B59|nr:MULTISPECIES: hypothetical protein [unclassified Tamlana]MDO6792612.1 hypothetical protein [Tamlana sp. 1_MG-2023]
MLLFMFVLLGCANKELPNEYVFSEPTADWYVIVNGCKDGGNFIEGNKRRFVFPENGILLANMENFDITKNDVFLIGEKSFDPNSEDEKSYKLCYHMISQNSGYDKEEFDFYFFRVGKSCDDKSNAGLDVFFDSLLDYLKNDKILSVK